MNKMLDVITAALTLGETEEAVGLGAEPYLSRTCLDNAVDCRAKDTRRALNDPSGPTYIVEPVSGPLRVRHLASLHESHTRPRLSRHDVRSIDTGSWLIML